MHEVSDGQSTRETMCACCMKQWGSRDAREELWWRAGCSMSVDVGGVRVGVEEKRYSLAGGTPRVSWPSPVALWRILRTMLWIRSTVILAKPTLG